MEVERTSTDRLTQRLIWLGCGAVGLALIAGAASPAVRRLIARTPQQNPVPAKIETPPHWSTEQVEELIAGIQDARSAGLEPKEYGLAALRGELDRRGGPSLSAGSVELDRLAETSALVLAEDLSRRDIADHGQFDWHGGERTQGASLVSALHNALVQGRLRAWLRSLRPPSWRLSPGHDGRAAATE